MARIVPEGMRLLGRLCVFLRDVKALASFSSSFFGDGMCIMRASSAGFNAALYLDS